MYENAFVYDFYAERPVKFGFSKEEREWLKRERSTDEIMDFIRERELKTAMFTSMVNNDMGFGIAPVSGKISKKNGKTEFTVTDAYGNESEIGPIGIEMSDETFAKYESCPYSTFCLIKYDGKDEGEGTYEVVVSCGEENSESLEEETFEKVIRRFVEYAGVNTYHKLGKIVNKGESIRRKWSEENARFANGFRP